MLQCFFFLSDFWFWALERRHGCDWRLKSQLASMCTKEEGNL